MSDLSFWSGSSPYWIALAIALFVCAYAAAFGEPDSPADLPRSSMDL